MTAVDQRLSEIERQLAALVAVVEDLRKDGAFREAFIEAIEDRAEARGFERARAGVRIGRPRPAARAARGSHLHVAGGGAR